MSNEPILPDLRSQLLAALTTSIETSEPPSSHRVRSRRSSATRRAATVTLAALALGGVATGAAAASGMFNANGNSALQAMAGPILRAAMKMGGNPIANTTIDPSLETVEGTEPGPEGTTLTIITYLADADFGCEVVVDSAGVPGAATHMNPSGGAINCGTHIANPGLLPVPGIASYHGNFDGPEGSAWKSPTSGAMYAIHFGRVVSEASRVELTFPGNVHVDAAVWHGWWALSTPSSLGSDPNAEVLYDANGSVLATWSF